MTDEQNITKSEPELNNNTIEPDDDTRTSKTVTVRITIFVASLIICLLCGFGISRDTLFSIYPVTNNVISSNLNETNFEESIRKIIESIRLIDTDLSELDKAILKEDVGKEEFQKMALYRQELLRKQKESNTELSQIKSLTDPLLQITNIIKTDITNLWLFLRAFFLGAFGALASMLMRWPYFLARHNKNDPGNGIMLSYCVLGGAVSIVAFGLFYTKEITIFSSGASKINEIPEFWRMTVLCMLSGAFAFRLFESADERVKNYLPGRRGKLD